MTNRGKNDLYPTANKGNKGPVSGFLAANVGQQNLKELRSRCFLYVNYMFNQFIDEKDRYYYALEIIQRNHPAGAFYDFL